MANLINKTFSTNRLQALYNTSQYIKYYKPLILLPPKTPFAKANNLLFDIPIMKDRFINLYVDNFISICLDKLVNSIHKATTCFNIITNVFNLFFTSKIDSLPENLKRKVALLLRKLQSEETSLETKKILDWIVNTRLLSIALLSTKGIKWKVVISIIITSKQSPTKELERLIEKLVRIGIIISGSNTFLNLCNRLCIVLETE